MSLIKISPSIMCADLTNLGEEIRALTRAGADRLHFDIMDGNFVPDIGLSHLEIEALRSLTSVPFEVHMMIINPLRYVEVFIKAGGNIICVHAESCTNLYDVIQAIKEKGGKASVALNPATPICLIENILTDLDVVLLMMVNPGHKIPGVRSADYIPAVLDKAFCLRQVIQERRLNIDIEADGSVNEKSIVDMANAGVNAFVVGSAIFDKGVLRTDKICNLRNKAKKNFLNRATKDIRVESK
ncbi:MAG: ribulose-phosphate 3-epimerase [bacterium]